MKKILLSICLSGLSFMGFSQVIFDVQAPSNLLGSYPLTYAKSSSGWTATPDLTVPANSVTDTLVFVSDGTAGDSLGCNALTNGAQVNGNIAVVYRGSCEFGSKAYNAWTAGARAVVIINNIPGAPIEMAQGTQGATVACPIVMITQDAGTALRDSIMTKSVVAFIGNKLGYYANDIGLVDSAVFRADRSANFALTNSNAAEFSFTPGALVNNYGTNSQPSVTLRCVIKFGGSAIYDQTSSAVSINSGDSAFFNLPAFSQASYSVGKYSMQYICNMSSANDYAADDTIESDFYISNNSYGFSHMNATGTEPAPTAYYRPSSGTSFSFCLYYKDANASKMAVNGIKFAATTNSPNVLTGEYLTFDAWKWDATFTDLNDIQATDYSLITNIQSTDFTYNGDYQDSILEATFAAPIMLANNQRYLFCINTSSANIFMGYDSKIDYTQNINYVEPQPLFPLDVDGTWYGLGFGAATPPAFTLDAVDASTLGLKENTNEVALNAYPNPASDNINIPVNGMTGKASLQIVDLAGKVVRNQQFELNGSVLKVDVSTIAAGSYIFNMNFENGKTAHIRVAVRK